MRIARRAPIVFALGVAALATSVAIGTDGADASSVQSGYWSQVPASPTVPAGGTEVASGPRGALAVAAFRFALPAGAIPGVLTLKLASAQPASQVSIEACPVSVASDNWKPTSDGAWAEAPVADCTAGKADGRMSSNGTTMSFALAELSFLGAGVDVELQPDPGSAAVPPTFDVAFDPAESSSLTTTAAPNDVSSAPPATFPAVTPAVPAPVSQPAAVTPGSFPVAGSGLTPVAAAADPALAPAGMSPVSGASNSGAGVAPPASGAGPSGRYQTAAATPSTTNWRYRAEVALGLLIADLLAVMWYQQRHAQDDPAAKKPLSIYDPPPLAVVPEESGRPVTG